MLVEDLNRTNLGLPYMGSKSFIANDLMRAMLKHKPNAKYFYDLFGGGGAMTCAAILTNKFNKIVYNEIEPAIMRLFKQCMTGKVPDEYYSWVTREEFYKHNDDNTAYGGFLKTVWSFGNKGYTYLYGKDIEYDKYLLHKVIVNKDQEACDELNNKYNCNIEINNRQLSFIEESLTDRLRRIIRYIKQYNEKLKCLQHLERLERLERLQHLERLEFYNMSYADVVINTPPSETIIYLDPPYKDTTKYHKKSFNHDELLSWIKNSKYTIFLSEYEANLPCIFEIDKRVTLSSSNNSTVKKEKLFIHEGEEKWKIKENAKGAV